MLTPGPGSFNVLIGGMPAWRGVPAMVAAGLQAAKTASDATIKAAEAATLAAAGTPGAPAAKAAEETAKAAAASAMGATISASAGGADIHSCLTPLPIPPHGPGVVIDGSPTVLINNLPACRQTDKLLEAVGPPDTIVLGVPTVIIGGVAPPAGAAVANGPYDSVDAAARAAMELANPQSIQANREYAGVIYQGADGKFYFTGPAQGTVDGADPLTDAPAPAGTTMVGIYHTHGAYSEVDGAGQVTRTDDPARDSYNSDNFSGQDRAVATSQGVPIYVATPNGTFREYDPATGSDTAM